MFECVAAVVRINLKTNDIATFEKEFFPLFLNILQNDITEFMPYVFQILALVVENKPQGSISSTDILRNIFPQCMMAQLWMDQGNVPPLTRFVIAFLSRQDCRDMVMEKINALLGLFQKMINSKANDDKAFTILNTMIVHLDNAVMANYLPKLLGIVFKRIQAKKTNKVIRGLLLLLSTIILNHGPNAAVGLINSIQPNMFIMVLNKLRPV